jgi:hypothetical protein
MNWRDAILKEFTPQVARLTLVSDPDSLLLEEKVIEGIRTRGFELIPFDDPVAFRYAYESGFRSRWDGGKDTELVVVLRSQESDLFALPYDLLQAGRKLSFSLGDIFPNLSLPVVASLERADLDPLFEAQAVHKPGCMGENDTKEFALRHVFGIAPELITNPSALLSVLLRRHQQGQQIPTPLDERLIQILRRNDAFADWPLETLFRDREAFFTFLQERWPIFLDRIADQQQGKIREEDHTYGLTIDGPAELPFGHDDVRVFIDSLFLDGMLHSVPFARADALPDAWLAVGILTDPQEDQLQRLGRLIEKAETSIPDQEAKYDEWFTFARTWAELSAITNTHAADAADSSALRVAALRDQVDTNLTGWLLKRYAGLVNLPPVPPVMVHHIPRFLSRQRGAGGSDKMALVVLDGMAADQWIVIRDVLSEQRPAFRVRERAVLAWIPTLTSVSRQAIFSGKAPFYFPNSITTTSKEPALWTQFWADEGLSPAQISYAKGLGDGDLQDVVDAIANPRTQVIGMVVDKIDRIVHGMELGAAGMLNQVRQWAEMPYLSTLLDSLLDNSYQVYLTSDHGNIEARGCGQPVEGAVADLRGQRVRIYQDELLRKQVHERFPKAVAWDPVGLPEDFLPLIAPPREAFVTKGQRTVSHGGMALEEIIVPFVQIERKGE